MTKVLILASLLDSSETDFSVNVSKYKQAMYLGVSSF